MSKTFRPILLVLLVFGEILQFFTIAPAQDIDVHIGLVEAADKQPAYFYFDGRFLDDTRPNLKNLVLLDKYAGTLGLAGRASLVSLTDKAGVRVAFKRFAPGEYLAESQFTGWNYNLALAPIGPASAKAHISWVTADQGILMLNDVLPQLGVGRPVAARVKIELPDDWQIITSEPSAKKGVFDVKDVDKAVFILSRNGNSRITTAPNGPLTLSISGKWQFADDEALAMASEILGAYEKIFGGQSARSPVVSLMHFPENVGLGNWEADTRGSTVTILSSDMPFKNQSVQRLHEQLRHEIFHLWMPNGVNLTGKYDWFYEGFALYQSLKLGVASNNLRFDDFLASLAQAYRLDSIQLDRGSLIAASERRWNGANTTVYARGMLVAFLCDLTMLERSKGKRAVTDLIREVYQRGASAKTPVDGNEVVLSAMRELAELKPIADKYITGSEPIDWSSELLAAGIAADGDGAATRLSVVPKPNGRQKDLLDNLGYNSWRKLSGSSK